MLTKRAARRGALVCFLLALAIALMAWCSNTLGQERQQPEIEVVTKAQALMVTAKEQALAMVQQGYSTVPLMDKLIVHTAGYTPAGQTMTLSAYATDIYPSVRWATIVFVYGGAIKQVTLKFFPSGIFKRVNQEMFRGPLPESYSLGEWQALVTLYDAQLIPIGFAGSKFYHEYAAAPQRETGPRIKSGQGGIHPVGFPVATLKVAGDETLHHKYSALFFYGGNDVVQENATVSGGELYVSDYWNRVSVGPSNLYRSSVVLKDLDTGFSFTCDRCMEFYNGTGPGYPQ